MPTSQTNQRVSVKTPLGKDKLLFERMSVRESLGGLFEIELGLLSKDLDLPIEGLIGQGVSVTIETLDGHERHFHGICSEFSYVGVQQDFAKYTAVLRPWLWLLTRTSDCRIFQEKTVPQIIQEVFREHGLTDFKVSLTGTYKSREYCVQYGETDCDFVTRLMEHEGIYYFFEHSSDKHDLVLADSYGAHSPGAYGPLPYYPPENTSRRDSEHLYEVTLSESLQSGAFALRSFDFEKPRSELEGKAQVPRSHDHSEFEVFEFPADYAETADGESYAKIRMDERASQYAVLNAQGDACALSAGNLFTLDEHPREVLNAEYLIVSSSHEFVVEGYDSSGSGGALESQIVRLRAIPSDQSYRPPRVTPTPVIQGPQTAIVVGKSGEEIWTDEHGRVKVQFHWDRVGTSDENSSCWIRVAHPWAGKHWGIVALPRMGHEVVVEFLGGNPDRPLVTGSVYNGDNKVPYDLPAKQTQSGMLSRSTKKGTAETFNELRFEDERDAEQVYFHAQKDFERYVEDADKLTVEKGDRDVLLMDGSQSLVIEKGNDTTEITEGNESTEIKKGNQSTEIAKGDQSTEIAMGDQTTKVKLGKIAVEAMQSIEFKVGGSVIKIDQKGVSISGTMIKIEGKAMAEMKSPMTTVKGDGMLTAKGGITMIN